jgi:NTP pyrophosphatase (non-canonical NTP hydrolase)
MTPKEYTRLSLNSDLPDKNYSPVAARLASNPDLLRLLHGAIGMSGEAGEILDAMKKVYMYGKSADVAHFKEECGDLLWYMALFLDAIGSSFEEVMQMNADKLAKRYPKGFTEKDALARADKAGK